MCEGLELEDRHPSIKNFKFHTLDTSIENNEHSSPKSVGRSAIPGGELHIWRALSARKGSQGSQQNPSKTPAKRKAGKLSKAEIEKLARPEETWEAARARLNQMPLDLA